MSHPYIGRPVYLKASEDSTNSSTTPLTAGASFQGTWNTSVQGTTLRVACLADLAGTLYIDQSDDGVTARSTLTFTCRANFNEVRSVEIFRKYARVRFTNTSSTNQTTFNLESSFGGTGLTRSPLNLVVPRNGDAVSVRPSNFNDEVVIGQRHGIRHFNKWGWNSALTAAGGEEVVWPVAAAFTPLTSASTFTIAYNSGTDGSGQTGARVLLFDYIDANGRAAQASHTLGNDGSDATSFTGLGINRISVTTAGSAGFNNNALTITATTGGSTQAYIPAGTSFTQQAIFHVDGNSYAVGKFLYLACNRLSGSNPVVAIKAYVYSRSLGIRYLVFRTVMDTATDTREVFEEPVGFLFSPGDIVYFVADTDRDSTAIDVRFSLREYNVD